MLYSVTFLKGKIYWHDEDSNTSIIFFAENDVAAYRFVSTISRVINKGFAKINEPRLVVSANLRQVHRVGQFGTKCLLVTQNSSDTLNFIRWKDLCDVYRSLFPSRLKDMVWTRNCVLNDFYEYKPEPRPSFGR